MGRPTDAAATTLLTLFVLALVLPVLLGIMMVVFIGVLAFFAS